MADQQDDRTPFVTRFGDTAPADRPALVLTMVRANTAALLGWETDAVDPVRPYLDYGYNSLAAIELTRLLAAEIGTELPLTLLFDYPTPAAVAEHLLTRLGFAPPAAEPDEPTAAAAPDHRDDPIAIVGMACRYPGGVSCPADLWRLVAEGTDAVSEFPADRGWDLDTLADPDPDRRGTSVARAGGFLDDVAGFDADFFGISPREATAMDPQHRLLLETTWAAIEDAGIDPTALRGSSTGVFVGLSTHDYASLAKQGPDELQGLWGIGTTGSTACGRLSYTFGFEGPAMTVDTACSSSLVAIDLACRSLVRGESSLAIAGGVAVLSTPELFVEFSRQGAINGDGRCRSFAEGADGTGWAEGVGLVLLERLCAARRNGHEVLALVRGSAVNSDGASNGLTAPNGPAQQRVIRRALADAGLTGADIDVVEGHGTGTVLGDPIEAQALLAVFGPDRQPDRPLWLGSLKSNIGHAQAAAGVGGVIKIVQALRHGTLPRTVHVDRPTTKVDWSSAAVSLLTDPVPWRRGSRPRRAGVSAFGVGGTNAHVIIEEAPKDPADPTAGDGGDPAVVPLVLSAKSPAALGDQARRLRVLLAGEPRCRPLDIAHSLLTTRSRFAHRAVVLGGGRNDLLAGLDAIATGRPADGVMIGGPRRAGKTAFVFPGQGSQWPGMSLALLDSSPTFASRFQECVDALVPHIDWAPYAVLRGEPGAPDLDRVDVTQPLLFTVMVSLAHLWWSFGVEPDAVLGHSQGEIAAACVAGALSITDAARVVAVRSRMLAGIAGRGTMLSVAESAEQVRARLAERHGTLSLAGISGPRSTVVSGGTDPVAALAAECAADGVWTGAIPVDYASHSVQVEPLRTPLVRALAQVRSRAAGTVFYSTLTGGPLDPGTIALDGDYWYRNLREPILAERTVRRMIEAGYRTFVEISPHPVLSVPMEQIFDAVTADEDDRLLLVGSLRRGNGGLDQFARSLAEIDAAQVPVNWAPLVETADPAPVRVRLPGYPFQRQRFWVTTRTAEWDAAAAGLGASPHPLVSAVTRLADGTGWLFTGRLTSTQPAWLADHAVHDVVLMPGTGFVELALHAAAAVRCDRVAELTIEAPLVLATEPVHLQVAVGNPDESGTLPITIYSRGADTDALDPDAWTCHVTGSLDRAGPEPVAADLPPWPGVAEALPVDGLYDDLADRGLGYGPALRGLRRAWGSGAHRCAEIELDPDTAASAGHYQVHPALLDSAFHVGLLGLDGDQTYLPFRWSGVRVHQPGRAAARVWLTSRRPDEAELRAYDETGQPVVTVESVTARQINPAALGRPADPLYRVAWQPAGPGRSAGTPQVEVVPRPAGPDADPAARVRTATGWALDMLHGWLARDTADDTPLAIVTHGAVAVGAGEAPDLAGAAVWGLVRSAQSEHPNRFLLVDLESDGDPVPTVFPSDEPQIAVRAGKPYVPRLVPAGARPPQSTPILRTDGTVVVTGGTSGLGAAVAEHLAAEHGVRDLLLLSRRGPDSPEAAGLVDRLAALGARATVTACDVADRAQLTTALAAVPAARPIRAVVHAAGVLDDGVVTALTPDRIDRVLRPKADAAVLLDELTAGLDLDAFVLFSSIASTLGGPGQGNYAAANAVLDALAARRHVAGRPATAQIWGLWAETGAMTGQLSDTDRTRLTDAGIAALSTADGLRLFDAGLGVPEPAVVLARFTRAKLRVQAEAGSLPVILRSLVHVGAHQPGTMTEDLATRLRKVPEPDRAAVVRELVLTEVAAVLGHPSTESVRADRSFKELGFDSLVAVQFRNRLTKATGQRIATTLVFDHPTPAVVAAYLLSSCDVDGPAATPEVDAELDRLAALLGSLPEADRPRVTDRLRGLLSQLDVPATAPKDDTLTERIQAADRADMLSLIDTLGLT